jgi:hypothetical protein
MSKYYEQIEKSVVDASSSDDVIGSVHGSMANILSFCQYLEQRINITEAQIAALEKRTEQANRLIAHNMFAIVRLEIATSCDAITNAILEVKREKTGSGSAACIMNVAGTLVMISGSVLTGGQMAVLGSILSAAGNTISALSENDPLKVIQAASAGIISGSIAAAGKKAVIEIDTGAPKAKTSEEVAGDVANSVNNGVNQVGSIIQKKLENKEKEKEKETTSFTVKLNRTAFIQHGSGGTSAITFDIQKAIVDAYIESCTQIGKDVGTVANDPAQLASQALLLNKIASASAPNGIDDMHPLTKHVLCQALKKLVAFKGEYSDVKGSTLSWSSTRKNAQNFVIKGYQHLSAELNAGKPLIDGRALIEVLKRT